MNKPETAPAGSAGQIASAEKSQTPQHSQHSLEHWLYLRHTPGIGNTAFLNLLKTFASIEDVFHASHSQLAALGLKPEAVDAITSRQRPDITADLNWCMADNHHIICFHEPAYPEQLKDLPDAPPLLYVRGDPDYLKQPQLAMVGARNPSGAGRNTAREFASHLANAGITIVSGLASGIDGASHEGALKGLAGTVAVLAHGLDIIYPAQHQNLAQRICEHGAVISEMPIGTQPLRGLFPRRNRLISALSMGTLVVEAAQKSGSLITAKYALEQNREVFAIPGSIHNPMARGCHQLIRQGAKLVETAADILEELCLPLQKSTIYPQKSAKNTPENPKQAHQALDPDHQKLLKCLDYEPTGIDELVLRSHFSAAEIASMLLILELEGIVVCQDGRYTHIK